MTHDLYEDETRQYYYSLFDKMEDERERHPELEDDDNALAELVYWHTIPMKEARRYGNQ